MAEGRSYPPAAAAAQRPRLRFHSSVHSFLDAAADLRSFCDPATTGAPPVQDDHVYRKTELIGSSSNSLSDAIETAIARASKTLRNLEWFEVSEIRGHIQDGKVAHYQVTLKVGFRVEE
jgi:flavin-binding protein dodecin